MKWIGHVARLGQVRNHEKKLLSQNVEDETDSGDVHGCAGGQF